MQIMLSDFVGYLTVFIFIFSLVLLGIQSVRNVSRETISNKKTKKK